jgi:hypothetical protein
MPRRLSAEMVCAVAVFVKKKAPIEALKPKHRISKEVPRHGIGLPKNVAVFSKLRPEMGFFFRMAHNEGF